MSDLLVGVGLLLAIEGTLYAAFPDLARRMMQQALDTPDPMLRNCGLAALALGVLLVWLARG